MTGKGIPDPDSPPEKAISCAELGSDTNDLGSLMPDICLDFEQDVDTLRDFSFISVSSDGTLFMMHRRECQMKLSGLLYKGA